MAVELKTSTLVIGTSLAAVNFAKENDCLVLFNTEPSFFTFNNTPQGAKEYEQWQNIASHLSMKGLNPFADKISALRINKETVDVFSHNRKYVVVYEKIVFFDDENIENFPFDEIPIKTHRVCDWFKVTSGTKHDYWTLETEDQFVNKIYFHTKITLPKYKDCVSESFLTKDELQCVDYSPTMSRLKTIDVMTKAGILGTKHTKTYRYPIKMQIKERQVFKIKEEIVQFKHNYSLDTREFK